MRTLGPILVFAGNLVATYIFVSYLLRKNISAQLFIWSVLAIAISWLTCVLFAVDVRLELDLSMVWYLFLAALFAICFRYVRKYKRETDIK